MTTTGSTPSTQTIRISPSASSSTPSRSMRRVVTGRSFARLGRGLAPRAGARFPLRLERLAQAVLRVLERHPCHDGLEKAEHDELARLVGRDAAALEVEQLVLVDRTDGRAVHRAAAVGLVDLEARDRDGACRLRQVHPELAEVAVRPDGRLLDR